MLSLFKYITLNTFRFNFAYFPFKTALKLPVVVSSNIILKELKGTVLIESELKTGMIKIGYGDVAIFSKNRGGIWQNKGIIVFKGNAFIGHGSKINCNHSGSIIFGKNFTITAESAIVSNKQIVFGNDCLISWDVLILDDDFHIINNYKGERINQPAPIYIGNHVWIGCRSLILKGTEIPDNSIVAAGALISGKLSFPNSIYGGNPASIIKKDIEWTK